MSKIFIPISIFIVVLFSQIINLVANDDAYINSSTITYNEKENIVELAENSKINFKNINILIDKGIIDYNKNEFEVFGNFYLYEELTILSGEDLKGNVSLDTFSANNVNYIYNNNLKIDSKILVKKDNELIFYNNFLTPCEIDGYFNCPTWSLNIDKTEYNIYEDKFTHYDTFLQIADYKVFYIPFFRHYGVLAPRKKGFLTPKLEFSLGNQSGIIAPYYFPVNESTEITFYPKVFLTEDLEILDNYELNTLVNKKTSGGFVSAELNMIKKNYDSAPNNSLIINTKNIINKNLILSASGFLTNNISVNRSINEQPEIYKELFLRIENYNLTNEFDYLRAEINSVESFEINSEDQIPISSTLFYSNQYSLKNTTTMNELDFTVIKRNKKNDLLPRDSFKINLKNEVLYNKSISLLNSYNKVEFNNTYKDDNLNQDDINSMITFSSDMYYINFQNITPRIKFILPIEILKSPNRLNEDSNAITFNYQSQFAENRFFGNDIIENSPRVVYGLENNFYINNQKFIFNINQSYDFKSDTLYHTKINQISNFSDYSLELISNYENINFSINSRLDRDTLSAIEMDYSLNLYKPIFIGINYNQTKEIAFSDVSQDTKKLNLEITKKINENINFTYKSSLDIENEYHPYKNSILIKIFDECSSLDLNYTNKRFNDNLNTKPEEKISLSFSMDYLGLINN